MNQTNKRILAVILALCLTLTFVATGCTSKTEKQKESNLTAAIKPENFEKVNVVLTMKYNDPSVAAPHNEAEKEGLEGGDYGEVTDIVTKKFCTVTKQGDLYYQKDEDGPEYYFSNENGIDFTYYFNDFAGIYKGKKEFYKYTSSELESTQGKKQAISFKFFDSITPEMFDYSAVDDSSTCRVTDEYERAVIQTIFPNNSFADGMSDISLDFCLSGKKLKSIIYRYTFKEEYDFEITYALDYSIKKIKAPTEFIDET